MPYRILKYEMEIMEELIDRKIYKSKSYKYPIVIPIILYTGHKRWNAELDLMSKQLSWNRFEGQELSRYNVIDVNDLDEEELLNSEELIDKALLIEKSENEYKIEENLNKILDLVEEGRIKFEEHQKDLLVTILQRVLIKQIGKEKTDEFVERLKEGGNKEMLAVLDMIDRERSQLRRDAMREGKREGKIEIIKNMLKRKMSIDEISEITGMKKEKILKIK